MATYSDLRDYFSSLGSRVIIAADAETQTAVRRKDEIVSEMRAGGVATVLDPIAKASNAMYITRGKTEEDKLVLGPGNKITVKNPDGDYTLKRLFFSEEEIDQYYYGYSNQTLWPLCHVAFEKPIFSKEWFEGYRKVNQRYAEAIKQEIKGKTFIWVHDYQLALVPKYIGKQRSTVLSMFWHIPWPTWEVFRILPNKKEILESLLCCDFIAFHRGYHVRNFLETVEREFEARIDQETNTIYYDGHATTVTSLPLGIDADVIKSQIEIQPDSFIMRILRSMFDDEKKAVKPSVPEMFFKKHKVILGIDRLDYTKGLELRLSAMDAFFSSYPQYLGKVVYVGIIAPSREAIPAYKEIKKDVRELAAEINAKYEKNGWKPIHLLNELFPRKEIVNFYHKADVCLVTPLDDGMNLVSKEFVVASALSTDPGMLILSQFAGSATDLGEAIIVNPYNVNEVAESIKKGLEMDTREKRRRIHTMEKRLEERNVYEWAESFVKSAYHAVK